MAPSLEAVTEAALEHSLYLNWNRVKIKKNARLWPKLHEQLTVHKLMGDTFIKLATALSSVEKNLRCG